MEILVAKHGGFCFGVRRAVQATEKALDAGRPIYTLGPIIHNPQVVAELAERGAIVVEDVEKVPRGSTLIIRSHGVAPDVYERARQRKLNAMICIVLKVTFFLFS